MAQGGTHLAWGLPQLCFMGFVKDNVIFRRMSNERPIAVTHRCQKCCSAARQIRHWFRAQHSHPGNDGRAEERAFEIGGLPPHCQSTREKLALISN